MSVTTYKEAETMWTFVVILSVLVAAMAAVPTPTTAQTTTGNVLSTDSLSLPRDHRYERYDANSGTYTKVDVNQVPALVGQKQYVYDRTAQKWVFHTQGVNPSYARGAVAGRQTGQGDGQWERVSGVVQSVNANQMTVRTDDNQTVTVDLSHARKNTSGGLNVGERVSAIGHYTAPNQLTARAVRDFRGAGRRQQAGQSGDWERLHGVVQNVQGSALRFRTDDGRVLNVDMANVGSEIRQALTQGEGATVIGYEWTGPNQLRAEYIQQDSSDASRPSALPRSR
jgi:hypothetical protein